MSQLRYKHFAPKNARINQAFKMFYKYKKRKKKMTDINDFQRKSHANMVFNQIKRMPNDKALYVAKKNTMRILLAILFLKMILEKWKTRLYSLNKIPIKK